MLLCENAFPLSMEAMHMKRALLVLATLLALAQPASTDPADEPRVSRFSGKPVPRFETLRWAEVNGRSGPNLSSAIAWQYNRKGLPVLVVKESGEWRRVRDPAGDEVWVHARMLEDGATAWVTTHLTLRQTAGPQAPAIAEIGEGVLVRVESCESAWCRVDAGGHRGWAPRAKLWGVDPLMPASSATSG